MLFVTFSIRIFRENETNRIAIQHCVQKILCIKRGEMYFRIHILIDLNILILCMHIRFYIHATRYFIILIERLFEN